jgi:hypothetical protein
MRERVDGVGGTLRAAPGDGGFVVDATIPLPSVPTGKELSDAGDPGASRAAANSAGEPEEGA